MAFIALVFARDRKAADKLQRVVPPDGYEDNGGYKIVALFHMPAMKVTPTCNGFCTRGTSGWGRAIPEGHMVHTCGKRHRDWRKRIFGSLFDTLGINLLPRADTPALFQNPDTWGS